MTPQGTTDPEDAGTLMLRLKREADKLIDGWYGQVGELRDSLIAREAEVASLRAENLELREALRAHHGPSCSSWDCKVCGREVEPYAALRPNPEGEQ